MTGPQIATLALGALLIAPILAAPVMRLPPVHCKQSRDVVIEDDGKHLPTAHFANVETCRRGPFVVSHRILKANE
jgi:hypothetical protein